MFTRKNSILIAALLILLIAAPVMAVEGSARFVISEKIAINGNEINPGVYEVKWHSNSPEAEVTFMSHGKDVLKVQGKVEELKAKNDSNSLLIVRDSSGHPTLKGLQFEGKKIRISF